MDKTSEYIDQKYGITQSPELKEFKDNQRILRSKAEVDMFRIIERQSEFFKKPKEV